jgi:predicted Zn-dependent peptidase
VEILGSGKTSRLYKSLYLKQHLVYAIDVAFSTEKGAGNVYIMSVFDPKNICEIKTEIKKQIKNIVSNGITEEELRRSKLSIKTDWKFSLETPLGIANTFGYWHLMGNAEFITEYIKKLESFTCSDIVKFFKKYYSQKTIFNVALLPKIK